MQPIKIVSIILIGYVYYAATDDASKANISNDQEAEEIMRQMLRVEAETVHDMELLQKSFRAASVTCNQYLLFTRENPTTAQELYMNNASSIISSNFNSQNPTAVLVHGWLGDRNKGINTAIRDAYLQKTDVNVIVLDWSRLAKSLYVTAVAGVPASGQELGRFLSFLTSVTGASYNDMHLIGHSLGAHLVGNAGRELNGKVARVTGLDPAGPLWNRNQDRLRSTDGVYVEAIHTDELLFGISCTVGDADFFPNGGVAQPGCTTNLCNHNRAWELYAATVTYNHLIGSQCTNKLQLTFNTCRGKTFPMGNGDFRKIGSGIYRLTTKKSYPY